MAQSKGEYTRKPSPRCNPHLHPSQKDIPLWEAYAYIAIWVSALFTCIVHAYQASQDHINDLNDYYLETGWLPWTTNRKDIHDFEWNVCSKWMLKIWKWFIGHLALSQFFRFNYSQYRKYILSAYSLIAIYNILGLPLVFLLLGHLVVMYLSIFLKSVLFIWMISLVFLLLVSWGSSLNFVRWFTDTESVNDSQRYYLILLSLSIKNLQYTSFALDAVEFIKQTRVDKSVLSKLKDYTFLDMLLYVTYLPLYFCGPVLTYEEFKLQFKATVLNPQVLSIIQLKQAFRELVRLLFWAIFIEVVLHYFYFNSLLYHVDLLHTLPLWQLAGIAYTFGQFFMVKYIVLYGVPSFFARLDGFSPPEQPKCVARIFNFSDLWKSFDRGLYNFIKRHIYVAIGGSRHGLPRQLFATFLSFCFIAIWHGAEWFLLVWCVGNYVGVLVEHTSRSISTVPAVAEVVDRTLTGRWKRRLYCMIFVPLYLLFTIQYVLFLSSDASTAMLYFQKFFMDSWLSAALVCLVFYSCLQTAYQISIWERQKLQDSQK